MLATCGRPRQSITVLISSHKCVHATFCHSSKLKDKQALLGFQEVQNQRFHRSKAFLPVSWHLASFRLLLHFSRVISSRLNDSGAVLIKLLATPTDSLSSPWIACIRMQIRVFWLQTYIVQSSDLSCHTMFWNRLYNRTNSVYQNLLNFMH